MAICTRCKTETSKPECPKCGKTMVYTSTIETKVKKSKKK